MTPEEFVERPSIKESWHLVSGPVREFLVEHLISTTHGATGGDNAQAEVGAAKELANLILLFDRCGKNPTDTKKREPIKGLKRFETTKKDPKTEKPNP